MPRHQVYLILPLGLGPEKGKFLAYVVGIDGISSNRAEERQLSLKAIVVEPGKTPSLRHQLVVFVVATWGDL